MGLDQEFSKFRKQEFASLTGFVGIRVSSRCEAEGKVHGVLWCLWGRRHEYAQDEELDRKLLRRDAYKACREISLQQSLPGAPWNAHEAESRAKAANVDELPPDMSAQHDDDECYARLVTSRRGMLVAYAQIHGVNRSDAEDIVDELIADFLVEARSDRYRDRDGHLDYDHLHNAILKAIRNRIIDRYRKRGRQRPTHSIGGDEDENGARADSVADGKQPPPDDIASINEGIADVWKAKKKLSLGDQEGLYLRFYAEFGFKDIAHILDLKAPARAYEGVNGALDRLLRQLLELRKGNAE